MRDVVGSEIFLAEQQLFMVFTFAVRQSYLQGRPTGKEAGRAGECLVFTTPPQVRRELTAFCVLVDGHSNEG